MFPQAKLIEYGIILVAILLVLATTFYSGYKYEKNAWDAANAKATNTATKIDTAASGITTEIKTVYVDRIKTITIKGNDIIHNVPVYITAKDDANCTINNGAIDIINNASQNTVPYAPTTASSVAAEEAPSDVTLSVLATDVVANYNLYNKVKQQLISLQDWVAAQYANNPGKGK